MTVLDLRAIIPNDYFTAWELNALLDRYANHLAKIASMLKKREIIQIRRGLYTFAEPLRRGLLSDGTLANQIHGPSYVSEDFALSYYGMIPEIPAVVTSITRSRSRSFDTEFGVFRYRYCRSQAYPVGVTVAGEGQHRFLIATPEKAIFDKVMNDSRFDGADPEAYLLDDLRLDEDSLRGLNRKRLKELAPFMTGRLKTISNYLEGLR